jgi:serine/threonine protein kinase
MLERFSNHPNIVRFMGVVDFGNKIAIVTELMKGSLAALIQKLALAKGSESEWALDLATKKRILRGTAAGMAHLHSHDVIHRDLKLENVLVNEGEWDTVRLCDFGTHFPLASRALEVTQ